MSESVGESEILMPGARGTYLILLFLSITAVVGLARGRTAAFPFINKPEGIKVDGTRKFPDPVVSRAAFLIRHLR